VTDKRKHWLLEGDEALLREVAERDKLDAVREWWSWPGNPSQRLYEIERDLRNAIEEGEWQAASNHLDRLSKLRTALACSGRLTVGFRPDEIKDKYEFNAKKVEKVALYKKDGGLGAA